MSRRCTLGTTCARDAKKGRRQNGVCAARLKPWVLRMKLSSCEQLFSLRLPHQHVRRRCHRP